MIPATSDLESPDRCDRQVVLFFLTNVGRPLFEKAYELYIMMEPKSMLSV